MKVLTEISLTLKRWTSHRLFFLIFSSLSQNFTSVWKKMVQPISISRILIRWWAGGSRCGRGSWPWRCGRRAPSMRPPPPRSTCSLSPSRAWKNNGALSDVAWSRKQPISPLTLWLQMILFYCFFLNITPSFCHLGLYFWSERTIQRVHQFMGVDKRAYLRAT